MEVIRSFLAKTNRHCTSPLCVYQIDMIDVICQVGSRVANKWFDDVTDVQQRGRVAMLQNSVKLVKIIQVVMSLVRIGIMHQRLFAIFIKITSNKLLR